MVRLRQFYFVYFGLNSLWLFLLQGCKEPDPILQDDRAYAPLAIGRYWIYEVREDRYSLSDLPTSQTYFLKEVISEPLPDSQQGIIYKLIRYKRSRPTESWKADSIWTVQQLPDKLIRTENNTAYVNLIFPAGRNLTWNRNEYNALPASVYSYANLREAYRLTNKTYPNTLRVVSNQNDSTAISLNRDMAVYAYQTGLIFRERTALAYCQSSANCIGKAEIASGYRQIWTLLDEGSE